jgi:hypothetical protein
VSAYASPDAWTTMLLVIDGDRPRRGGALLLAHCAAGRPVPDEADVEPREPANDRLERQMGAGLARLLVRALGRR